MNSKLDGAPVSLSLKSFYRTGLDEIGHDFFGPCLSACTTYNRAAGYFSSSALVYWAAALPKLVKDSSVSIRLLISPEIQPDDLEVLRSCSSEGKKAEVSTAIIDEYFEKAAIFARDPRNRDLRLELFAHLISINRITIRLAYMARNPAGIYHEKFGIFGFPNGDSVGFIGSANESLRAYEANGELLMVFQSAHPADRDRVNMLNDQFERAWEGLQPGLSVVLPSEGVLQRLALACRNRTQGVADTDRVPTTVPRPPPWKHQRDAIEKFLSCRKGVLEMATGTGKTKAALEIVVALFERGEIDSFIVSTDGNDLLQQWCRELTRWRRETQLWARQHEHFAGTAERETYMIAPGGAALTISRSNLAAVLKALPTKVKSRLLVIHDEVHGLGAPGTTLSLNGVHDQVRFVLGLSATPEREYDMEGTKFIESEIGPVIFRYDLGDAIRDGILCEFDYVPLDYVLTECDRERLANVWKMKSARSHQGTPMSDAELAIQLAKVYKTAELKPSVFAEYLLANPECLSNALIFVETREYGNAVLDVVHRHTLDYKTYYADDEEKYLKRFARGDLKCLITCHRLSQGIDIPALKTVVLFSSSRARLETIQRIGRCLRIDRENPSKKALIIDFVARGSADTDDSGVAADISRAEWLSGLSSSSRSS